jgi:hypothetical protein
MPTYSITAPNGKTYSIEGPAGATQDDVIRQILARDPEAGTPMQPRKGLLADVAGGATNLLNIGRTGIAALMGDSNAAAQAGLEREKNLQQQYESGFQPEKILSEYDKGNYLSAAGEAVKQVPSAVAGLLPSIGQEAGLIAAGRLGGGALGALVPVPGAAAIGATAGQYAVPFIVNAIQALGSQAQEKAKAQVEKGEKVDVDVAELAPYAAGNAALNLVGTRIAMPSVFKKAIGQKVAAEAEDEARLALMKEAEKVAGRGTLKTVARGALGFTVGELPTEVLQDVVDRAAVGQPLADADALKQYRITALNMALGAPLGGAIGLHERSGAREQVALQGQKDQQAKAAADAQAKELAAQAPSIEKGLFPTAEVPTAPETNLKGEPMERTAPEAPLEEPIDFQQQTLGLQRYLTQLQEENQKLPPTAYEQKRALSKRAEAVQKALDVLPQPVNVKQLTEDLDALHKKITEASDLGDMAASGKYADEAAAIAKQLTDVAPSTGTSAQQQIEMPKQVPGYTGISETREQFRDRRSKELGDQRAETLARLDAEYQAAQNEYARKMKVQAETKGLQRIGERPPVLSQDQLGLFGPNDQPELAPSQNPSAVIGQMKQSLTGEPVTATPPSETGGIIRRGGPAPFNLYPRKEGTETPLSPEVLRQRIYDLGKREDLTSEAAAFLRRVEPLIGENDKDGSFFPLLDEQLGKMESGKEGVTLKGAPKPVLYQGFPVEPQRGVVSAPTVAESKAELKDLKSGEAAKALARTRAVRYQQGIATGETPKQAAYNARLVAQPDEAAMRSVLPQGQVPVQKRGNDITAETLRGPAKEKPLAIPDTLEQQLRQIEQYRQTKSDFDKEPESQLALFPEEQAKIAPVVRATPENFQKFLGSKTAAKLRGGERPSGAPAEPAPARAALEDTRRKADEISAARTRAWNVLSQLPSTKYRALTPEERKTYQTSYEQEVPLDTEAKSDEVKAALKYEQKLAKMQVQQLKMEQGIVEKAMRQLEAKINAAKAKSVSFLRKSTAPELTELPLPSGPVSLLPNVRKPRSAKGQGLTMYGPKGSPFTKPAFVGVEGFIKKQAALALKLDALEKELAVKEAAATPISKGARGEEETRAVAPATAVEEDEIGMAQEKAALYAVRKEEVNSVAAALEEAKKEGDKKAVATLSRALVKAREAFAETVVSARQRVNALTNTLAAAKAAGDKAKVVDTEARLKEARDSLAGDIKLIRSRTQQLSRNLTGINKNKLTEELVYKAPSAKTAVADANKFAQERLAAAKPLTKKEVNAATLAQQEALQRAAFDRVQTVTTQVANAQQKVNNLKQVQADYKAGRRSTFNVEVLNNAVEALDGFKKSLVFAREQAGMLEDVGAMTDKEISEAKQAEAAATKKGKGKADIAAQETEAAVSDVYAGAELEQPIDVKVSKRGVVYSTSKTAAKGPGMREAALERLIKRIADGWTNSPTIIHAPTFESLPKATKDQARADKVQDTIRGVYDPETKTAYLVGDRLHTAQDVIDVLAHEVTGHYGLRETLGAGYTKVMNDLYKGNNEVRARANEKLGDSKAQIGPNLNIDVAVEEVLAEMAEDPKPSPAAQSALRRVYNYIKEALKKYFKGQTVSDEAVRQIVENARKYVVEGGTKGEGEAPIRSVYSTAKYGEENALTQLARDAVSDGSNSTEKVMDNAALKFEMNYVDMRAALRKVLELGAKAFGDSRLFQQAMFSYTDADQKTSLIYTALTRGWLKISTDAKGFKLIESSGKESAKDVFADVGKIPDKYGDEQAKVGLATAYLAAHRAANKGLSKLDLEALGLTEEKMAAALADANADPELKNALEKVRETYNAYNEGMVRMVQASGAITKEFADELLKDKDYVPYYRVRDNGTAVLVLGNDRTLTVGDIKHQPWLKELKGGETKILPITQSIPRNTMLLVSMATGNMARRNVAYAMQEIGRGQGEVDSSTGRARNLMPILSGKGPDDPSIIRFKQEPDPNKKDDNGDRYIRIQTKGTIAEGVPAELVLKSMEGAPLTLPAFLKWGGIAGDLLRKGVTRMPPYLLRQLFRDPMVASATSGLDYGMLRAVYNAGKEFLKLSVGESETAASMLNKGLMQSGIFTGDPDDVAKMALQLVSGKDFNVIDRICRAADKAAINADAATRILVYENAVKNGLSDAEAKFAVQESMNFNKRGLSANMQYASRMIPFFNAQIQGLNVLYKAARGQMPFEQQLQIRQKFINNAMLLAIGGVAYAMAMQDDDYYKNAKPKDRYSNFFLHTPFTDEPLKLPIPYEFGWFFSLGAAAADSMLGQTDGAQQAAALQSMFVSSIPGSSSMGVPQIVKPLAEVWTNKDFNTGFALESTRLRGKSVEERYNANTTELAKAMSKFAPILSPIQIERIVGGYFGQLPVAVMAATNGLFKDGEVEPLPKNWSEMPIVGSSFQKKYGGADTDVMYKLADEALQVKRDFDAMKREGRVADARDFIENHRVELRVAPLALQYQKLMGNFRAMEERIKGSNLPGDEKRKRIDELEQRKQDLAQKFEQRIKQMES